MIALGAPRLITTGNLKFDVPAPPCHVGNLESLKQAIGGRPVIAAASTHEGEEAAMIEAHRRLSPNFPGLLTLIAPRHPDRGPAIAERVAAAGMSARLRSRGELPDAATDIYVADTLGELGLIYRLAPVVFIGGSLVRHGGQNPIEAAKLGAAIVHGPHVWNFAEVYAALDEAHGAEPIADVSRLTGRLGMLLAQPAVRERVAENGIRYGEGPGRRARTHACNRSNLICCSFDWSSDRAMREPAFWWRKAGLRSGPARPRGRRLWRYRRAAHGEAGAQAPGCRCCASAISPWAAPARRPRCMALAKLLAEAGEKPFCLSRGYGGSAAGPKLVDVHIRSRGSGRRRSRCCWRGRRPPSSSRDRVAGAALAKTQGASVIIMDDGLQNPSLKKDFTLAVIDGKRGIGNARVFPAGPLRAPLAAQLARTDALLVMGDGDGARDVMSLVEKRGLPVLHGRLVPDAGAVAELKGRKVLTFAGIGDPEKFFATAVDAGIAVTQRRRFPDHHRFSAEEAAALDERCGQRRAGAAHHREGPRPHGRRSRTACAGRKRAGAAGDVGTGRAGEIARRW